MSKPAARWAAIGVALAVALILAMWAMGGLLSRLARERAMRGLRNTFASDLELKRLDIRVFPRFHMEGEGLVLHYQGRRDLPPLISIERFTADDGLLALLTGHIRQVRVAGLQIQVPRRQPGDQRAKRTTSERFAGFILDEVIADGTVLKVMTKDPAREPMVWKIRRLTLHSAGAHAPMTFQAKLENAEPPGTIDSAGKFGPWQAEDPGATPVEGSYTFQNADLSVFNGIAGTLSSTGKYRGVLERIEVNGETDTPDFALKLSGNPVELRTEFQAVVDGTDGDTELRSVSARLGSSTILASGSVAGGNGVRGKTISIDANVPDGRLEDMLRLGASGPPAMTGAVAFETKLTVPPGSSDIAQRIELQNGEFHASSARFSKVNLQEKVNQLSHSGRGEPKAPASATVASDFTGRFRLGNGTIAFDRLSFRVPGVAISLHGSYGLLSRQLDFHGTAEMEAKLSQATTGIKSVLLKAVDRFFEKPGAGAVIPFHIAGTRDHPSFGLDFHGRK